MKILVIAPQPFYQDRGTPIAVMLLARALAEAGHRVDVLAYHEGTDPELPGVGIRRIPWGPRGVPPGPSWKKLVCDGLMGPMVMGLARDYDILHAVEEAGFMAFAASKLLGTPYVLDMDSILSEQMAGALPALGPLWRGLERAERAVARRAAGVVVVCRVMEEKVRGWGVGNVLRLEDISLLELWPTPQGELEPWEMPRPVVMYVGNLQAYQGLGLLIEAFKIVVQAHPTATLVVIGGTQGEIASWNEKLRAMGLEGRVRLLGPRPPRALGWYLARADVVVSPRIMGTNTPMKLYSYLDSGVPVVATKLITHTQVLDPSVAELVEPHPLAMAAGILRVLAEPSRAADMAARAKALVRERFSYRAFKDKLVGFYEQLERRIKGSGRQG